MTMPSERTRAVNHTREFLYNLIDSSKTPRIPKHIRQQAHGLLRHYPSEYDMNIISERESMNTHFAQRVFGEPEFFK